MQKKIIIGAGVLAAGILGYMLIKNQKNYNKCVSNSTYKNPYSLSNTDFESESDIKKRCRKLNPILGKGPQTISSY